MRTDHYRGPQARNQSSHEASLDSATSDLHRELDQLVAAFDLTSPADYRRFLLASAAALLALETLLESSGVENLLSDWPVRTRSAAITADLDALGAAARPMELRRKPPTGAEMFGMLYVLEATRRESTSLLERAMASPDAAVREATRYLQANDAALWSTFVAELETDPATADQSQTVAGAIYAFTIYIRSFEHAP